MPKAVTMVMISGAAGRSSKHQVEMRPLTTRIPKTSVMIFKVDFFAPGPHGPVIASIAGIFASR